MTPEDEAFETKLQRFKDSQADLINLNVGGQRLTTTRSTLRQVEGSFLAKMFSGGCEGRLKRDKDDPVFFDFNPQYFIPILDYLRARKIASADHPAPLPTVPKDQLKAFISLVKFLGLSDEILSSQQVSPGEKFNKHSTDVLLEENGKVAVHTGKPPHQVPQYVLGENIYKKGIANLKLMLESFENYPWMFVGILKDDAEKVDQELEDFNSLQWSGSYGWELGSKGGTEWKNGRVETCNNPLTQLCKQGDTIELVLDCEAGKLSLHLPPGHKLSIEIPKAGGWRLNVTLMDPQHRIRIMEN